MNRNMAIPNQEEFLKAIKKVDDADDVSAVAAGMLYQAAVFSLQGDDILTHANVGPAIVETLQRVFDFVNTGGRIEFFFPGFEPSRLEKQKCEPLKHS